MRGTYGIRRRFRSLLWRPRPEDEVTQEMAFHLEMRARELVARGVDEDEAWTQARRRFGDTGRIADDCRRIAAERNRRMRFTDWIEDAWSDVRYALRQMVRKPSFTLMVMLTLGVGIGANTAVFNVINGFLLRPLPVPGGDELVVLAARQPDKQVMMGMSLPALRDVQEATLGTRRASGATGTQRASGATAGGDGAVFSDLTGWAFGMVGLATEERAENTVAGYVTGDFFSLLRIEAQHGRLLVPGEGEAPGADPVVVLSHSFWQRHLAEDPSIVGQTVRLNGAPYTVVGIAPEGFNGPVPIVDMGAFVPLGMLPQYSEVSDSRESRRVRVLGRLAPGVSIAAARSSLAVVAERLGQEYANEKGYGLAILWETRSRPEPPAAEALPVPTVIFMVLVCLVLLVACFNVANLLLLKATLRRSEIAVRSAFGATRGRIVRQLLTESVLLASLGGVLGFVLAAMAGRYIESLPMPGIFPVALDLHPDFRVALYVSLAVVVSGVIVGLVPALKGSRGDLVSSLHEQGRSAAGGRRHRLRNSLVVAQVAISLLLLTTAGIFVRVARQSAEIDLGFTTEGVLKVHVNPSQVGYDEERTASFFRQLRERAEALPGVAAAGVSYRPPMGHYWLTGRVAAEGAVILGDETPAADDAWTHLFFNSIDRHYLETLEMPIVHGRRFDERETADSVPVAVINQHLAETLWPGEDALGRRLHLIDAEGPALLEVVGISRDARYAIPYGPQRPHLYVPQEQRPTPLRVLYLRTAGQAASLVPSVRALVRDLEPNVALSGVGEMAQILRDDVNGFFVPRIAATVASAIGVLGLILATVGLYGVMASTASQRRQEIGVRMALGANRGTIVRMVLRQGLVLVGIGLAVGAVFSLGATSLVGSLLFGSGVNDLMTSTVVIALLAGSALVACWVPARRASGVEVTAALRCE